MDADQTEHGCETKNPLASVSKSPHQYRGAPALNLKSAAQCGTAFLSAGPGYVGVRSLWLSHELDLQTSSPYPNCNGERLWDEEKRCVTAYRGLSITRAKETLMNPTEQHHRHCPAVQYSATSSYSSFRTGFGGQSRKRSANSDRAGTMYAANLLHPPEP